jgi:hypothetical protein
VPLYLAGARLLELFPMMPTMGNLTLVVAVVSYAGQLNLTAIADRDGCPDLEVFTQGVRATLDDLAGAGDLVTAATPATSATYPRAASSAEEGSSHVGSAQS